METREGVGLAGINQQEKRVLSWLWVFAVIFFFFLSFIYLSDRAGFLVAACGILVLQARIQPKPLHWKCRVLTTTGPPGKFPHPPTLAVLRLLLTEVDREVDGERVFL